MALSAPVGRRDAVLAGGEQADGERAEDAADAMWTGHGADRVVDPEVLDEVDAERHEDAGDGADHDRASVGDTQ